MEDLAGGLAASPRAHLLTAAYNPIKSRPPGCLLRRGAHPKTREVQNAVRASGDQKTAGRACEAGQSALILPCTLGPGRAMRLVKRRYRYDIWLCQ